MSKSVVILKQEESSALADMVTRTKQVLSAEVKKLKESNDRLFQVLDKIQYNLTTQSAGGIFEFDRTMTKELLKIVDMSNLLANRLKDKYEKTPPDKFVERPKEQYIAQIEERQVLLKIIGDKLEKALNG